MSKYEHQLKKNQIVKAKIESMAPGGQGFCKHDGVSIFVDRGVPGDFAELDLYDVRKDFAHARIVRLIDPSALRDDPPCRLFNVCGGCQWQHLAYQSQLDLKTDIVKQALKHIAGLDAAVVLPTLAAPDSLHYRNKVQYPVASPQNSSRILAGYYKEGSHELINIKHCPVQPKALDAIIESAKVIAERSQISAFDEKAHRGLLRHIIARYSFSYENCLLTLVLNAKSESLNNLRRSLERFAFEIREKHPAVIGVCVNFNNSRGNRIMGSETQLISGKDHILEKLVSEHPRAPKLLQEGVEFQLSPASFFQVNTAQTVRLLDLVLDAVQSHCENKAVNRIPCILDAYAGVASIAMWVSPLADRVLAVEEVPDAIQNANDILKLNHVENVEARCGTVEEVFPRLIDEGLAPNIVILDPPRKGVDRSALDCVVRLHPERIIYVSCNPATLARDLKILCESAYTLRSIQPLDLFPQTYHVESIAVLDAT